jgi:hypothetical protein
MCLSVESQSHSRPASSGRDSFDRLGGGVRRVDAIAPRKMTGRASRQRIFRRQSTL